MRLLMHSDEKERLMIVKQKVSGIYLLPNLLTTSSLFAAFYSIVASFKGFYDVAAIAVFIGMIADSLDGRIARMTNTQTAFGAEYDSLSDLVTFGVAPAMLIYAWGLEHWGKLGWLVSFIHTAAVALRLARFNTQLSTADKRYFQGLACPTGGAILASLVWFCETYHISASKMCIVIALISLVVSVLMVSNIRYYSFKDLDVRGKNRFLHVLIIVVLFVAVALNPQVVLLAAFGGYALSGPMQTLIAVHRMRKHRRQLLKGRKMKKSDRS
jgi:CDP-diacylglycerol---serine O-phosphatidyltransferase